ncbi:MFS transporter [Arthrobacter sp. NPDC080031]|uniref:MFS transporter n=1 Tax=Arthrobacter sp. NPDC080031 TaxID=3155918 RepID=UPI0034507A25
MDIKSEIRNSPMSRFQIMAVAVCLVLIMIDGFDVLVMSFAAPALSAEWHVPPIQLGYLLSAGLFGMAIGSVFLTPFADRIGRRRLTLLCLAIISLGMILSIVTVDVAQLIACRVFTGLGIGGMIANLSVIVSEYSSDKRRGLAMGIYSAGYPIGGSIGGAIAGVLIAGYGWRAAFAFGAAISVAMFIVCWFTLPESLEYLAEKRQAGSLPQMNRILVKMGRTPLTELPEAAQSEAPDSVFKEVFGRRMLAQTLLMWLGYAFLIAAFYFANTWTPKILAAATGDNQVGVTAGVLVRTGGIVGSIGFGIVSTWVKSRRLNTICLLLSAAAYLAFAGSFGTIGVALGVAVLLGMLTNSGVAGYYTIVPPLYSARARASGFGWMIGVGRLISIIAPIMVGYLIDAGMPPVTIFYLFAIPLVVSAGCCVALGAVLRRSSAEALPAATVAT